MTSPQRYMSDRVSIAAIGIGACAVVAGVLIGIVAAFVLLHAGRPHVNVQVEATLATPPRASPAAPVDAQPASTIAAFDAEKSRLLHEYAWVDRTQAIVRIPIDVAMDRLVREAGVPR